MLGALWLTPMILAFTLLLPAPAQARYCASYGWQKVYRAWPHDSYTQRYCRRWARDDGPRVYGYEQREDEGRSERREAALDRGEYCKPEVVRVVGSEHLTENGAKEAAIRQWQATVRYDHGEKYLDIGNAREMRFRCDRSGTNETVAGRVGEAVSGGTGYLKRCIVEAIPCRTPMHRDEKEAKDQ